LPKASIRFDAASMLRSWWLVGWLACSAVSVALAELSPAQLQVLAGLARDKYSGRWVDLTTNQLAEVRLRAEAYQDQLRERHLPGGLVVSLRYADTNRTEPVAWEALELSGAWTGLYLNTAAYRYAVLRESETLNDVRAALAGIEVLLKSADRPGTLPRFAGRGAEEAYQKFYSAYGGEDPARPGFGRLAFRSTNAPGQVWLAGPSREVYAGINLGLAQTYYYIREPKIRERVSNIVAQVVGRLESDGGRLDDGRSDPTFAPPLLRLAWLRTAATVAPRIFAETYERRAADFLALRDDAVFPEPGVNRYGGNLAGVFKVANLFALSRLETNQTRKVGYQEMLTKTWQQSQSQTDPWMAAAYLSAFDRTPADSTARIVLQGVLYQFPGPPRWSDALGDVATNDLELVTIGDGQFSRYPIPVARRPVAPFQWAATPTRLSGTADKLVVHPGVDFLLPYWMGRDLGIVPSEDSVSPISLDTLAPRSRFTRTNSFRRTNAPLGRPLTNSPAPKTP
jgi:hypothetical protein